MKLNFATLILRLTFGFIMFASHGLPKLMAYSSRMEHFPDPLGIGNSLSLGLTIFAEVICAGLITFGLFTRLATLPLITTMAVAVLLVHAGDPWKNMEMGTLYLLGYVAIMIIGPGQWSLDNIFRKKY